MSKPIIQQKITAQAKSAGFDDYEFVVNNVTDEAHHIPFMTSRCNFKGASPQSRTFHKSLAEARKEADLCGWCFKSRDNN